MWQTEMPLLLHRNAACQRRGHTAWLKAGMAIVSRLELIYHALCVNTLQIWENTPAAPATPTVTFVISVVHCTIVVSPLLAIIVIAFLL